MKKKIKKFLLWPYVLIKKILGYNRLKKRALETPCRIVIGASGIFDKSWIPTEADYLNLLKKDDWFNFFRENTIDTIIAEHVWEHLTLEEGELAARNCFTFLKQGGYLRCAVPDGFHPSPTYIEHVKINGTGPGAFDHKVLYNYHSFSEIFEKAGFKVNLLEYFDETGSFHAIDWKEEDGLVRRSKRFDKRNINGELVYTSLIIDVVKESS